MSGPPKSTFPPPSSVLLADPDPVHLSGIAGSAGIAIGRALVLGDLRTKFAKRFVSSKELAHELERVEAATRDARRSLMNVSEKLTGAAQDTTPILDAYLLMIDDPMLHERVRKKISREKKCAEWAVSEASEEIARLFDGPLEAGDAYIAERRHDVEFACDQILRALVGDEELPLIRADAPMIVVARDLSPAHAAGMVREPALAFVTEGGSRTSHTSIMARALEIPAVVGLANALTSIQTGDVLVVDGMRGTVIVHPDEADIAAANVRAQEHHAFTRKLLAARDRPGQTSCGVSVYLKANVELAAEAVLARDHGAQGIGLYRTEFLYIDRRTQPTEDEQYETYRAVIEATLPHPVTLRTFDIGGDKFASSFNLPPEMNPALGLRAVRLALSQPEVFLTQLRAMVRASAHGEIRIMVPLVTSVREIRDVRALLDQATRDVSEREGRAYKSVPLGIMIEVPAAAVMADLFARDSDFFSIGTNDLVQYALAVDRSSRSLAQLASPLDPSILRMIRGVIVAGTKQQIPVSVCGTMASDPLSATLLVGLGLRELSMEAAAIPEIKEAISRISVSEAEAIAASALECESAEMVDDVLTRALAERYADLLAGVGEPILITRSTSPPRR